MRCEKREGEQKHEGKVQVQMSRALSFLLTLSQTCTASKRVT